MTERPILFSGPMVRAILAGAKTQTRRIIKDGWWRCLDPEDAEDRARAVKQCPHGVVGDRLWVREQFATDVPGCAGGISYRADHQDPRGDGPAHPMRWLPPIFMPRTAARLILDVADVRVQRLQDISEDDARAEGVEAAPFCRAGRPDGMEHVESFEDLWDSINATRASWKSNPWVWAVTFRRLP